jgi:hypothetical protein
MGVDGWPNSRELRQGSAEKYEQPLGEENVKKIMTVREDHGY